MHRPGTDLGPLLGGEDCLDGWMVGHTAIASLPHTTVRTTLTPCLMSACWSFISQTPTSGLVSLINHSDAIFYLHETGIDNAMTECTKMML